MSRGKIFRYSIFGVVVLAFVLLIILVTRKKPVAEKPDTIPAVVIEKLYKAGSTTQQNYDSAKAQADASKAQYDLAKLQMDYTEVRAPVDGTILETDFRGLYSVYNLLAVYSALKEDGHDCSRFADNIKSFTPGFGRNEIFWFGEKRVNRYS